MTVIIIAQPRIRCLNGHVVYANLLHLTVVTHRFITYFIAEWRNVTEIAQACCFFCTEVELTAEGPILVACSTPTPFGWYCATWR